MFVNFRIPRLDHTNMQDHSPTSQRILEIISEDEEDIEINISRASAFKKKDESTMVQDQTMISKSQYNIQYSPDEPILQYFSNGKSPQYKSVLFENPNEQPFGNPVGIFIKFILNIKYYF